MMYVQIHNVCQSIWYLNPEAQSCSVVGELELELGTQADNVYIKESLLEEETNCSEFV